MHDGHVRRIRSPHWLVKSVATDPGFSQPTAITSYSYDWPVHEPDLHGRRGFRGFDAEEIVPEPEPQGPA